MSVTSLSTPYESYHNKSKILKQYWHIGRFFSFSFDGFICLLSLMPVKRLVYSWPFVFVCSYEKIMIGILGVLNNNHAHNTHQHGISLVRCHHLNELYKYQYGKYKFFARKDNLPCCDWIYFAATDVSTWVCFYCIYQNICDTGSITLSWNHIILIICILWPIKLYKYFKRYTDNLPFGPSWFQQGKLSLRVKNLYFPYWYLSRDVLLIWVVAFNHALTGPTVIYLNIDIV